MAAGGGQMSGLLTMAVASLTVPGLLESNPDCATTVQFLEGPRYARDRSH